MSRPKLIEQDKKIKLSVTISRETNNKLETLTNNKSSFIDKIISEYYDQKSRK